MLRWARAFMLVGIVLTGLAVLPAALQLTVLPGIDPAFAALALYSVAPLGFLSTLVAAGFLTAHLIRR